MVPFAVKGYLSPWLLPPTSSFLLIALGLLLLGRARWLGRLLLAIGLMSGLALSLPIVSERLMAWVEAPYATLDPPPLRLPTDRQAQWRDGPEAAPQAIVLLAGGSTTDGAASRAPNRPSASSLERVMHAHRLARLTKLPILISGGVTLGGGDPEAELMRRVLEADLATPVKWIEATSRDTGESARATAAMLQPAGIRRVLLVTHAYHMLRAERAYAGAGFQVVPAPHSFLGGAGRFAWLKLVPSETALTSSRIATREIIGRLWYRFP
jgi:uncharacterized SAM-binding protein YcdF (DUF218 family)